MAKKGKKKQLKRQNVIIGTIAVVVLVAVVAEQPRPEPCGS